MFNKIRLNDPIAYIWAVLWLLPAQAVAQVWLQGQYDTAWAELVVSILKPADFGRPTRVPPAYEITWLASLLVDICLLLVALSLLSKERKKAGSALLTEGAPLRPVA